MLSCSLSKEPFLRDAKCQASEETDLENGTQVVESNSDFEMEAFNKQVYSLSNFILFPPLYSHPSSFHFFCLL